MLLSEVFGKTVVDKSTGHGCGKIRAALINKRSGKMSLLLADEVFSKKKITGKSRLVIVRGLQAKEYDETRYHAIKIGEVLLSDRGEELGEIVDYDDEKKLVLTKSGTYELKNLIVSGEYAVMRSILPSRPIAVVEPPVVENKPSVAKIVSTEYGFLIGRILRKDVRNINETVFLPHGTVVTAEVIDYAKKNEKLSDLVAATR